MPKEKISLTVSADVLRLVNADLITSGENRSEFAERAFRNEHLRRELARYRERTVPALGIDDYAEQVYRTNRAAGL